MDLFCPHCTRRVTVPDDKAGQILSCPLCAKQFMAPSLAPATPPAPPPPPSAPSSAAPTGSYGVGPAPAPPPSAPAPSIKPVPPSQASQPPQEPPPPPRDYSRTMTCYLRGTWLSFVPLVCLLLIFVLSFFNWHQPAQGPAHSLWGLAGFVKEMPHFLAYTILLCFCILLALPSLLIDKQVIVMPPSLKPFLAWKDLMVALFVGLGFLLLCGDYVDGNFSQLVNPIQFSMKVAFRLQLLAFIALLLLFWAQWRKLRNLPPAKCELHL